MKKRSLSKIQQMVIDKNITVYIPDKKDNDLFKLCSKYGIKPTFWDKQNGHKKYIINGEFADGLMKDLINNKWVKHIYFETITNINGQETSETTKIK